MFETPHTQTAQDWNLQRTDESEHELQDERSHHFSYTQDKAHWLTITKDAHVFSARLLILIGSQIDGTLEVKLQYHHTGHHRLLTFVPLAYSWLKGPTKQAMR